MAKVQSVEDYIAGLNGWQAEVGAKLHKLVMSAAPAASHAIKWGQPTYEDHGQLCYIKAAKDHVSFGFFRGAELEDPQNMLEGSGTKLRHTKIREGKLDEKGLKQLVKSASRLNHNK